jgi:hypothetical protein
MKSSPANPKAAVCHVHHRCAPNGVGRELDSIIAFFLQQNNGPETHVERVSNDVKRKTLDTRTPHAMTFEAPGRPRLDRMSNSIGIDGRLPVSPVRLLWFMENEDIDTSIPLPYNCFIPWCLAPLARFILLCFSLLKNRLAFFQPPLLALLSLEEDYASKKTCRIDSHHASCGSPDYHISCTGIRIHIG